MELGGPVWHTSVRPIQLVSEKELRRMTNRVLDGVGDARLGEWVERHESMHVRRRLSEVEALLVGPVVDIRGTDEALRRAQAVGDRLRYAPPGVLAEELGP